MLKNLLLTFALVATVCQMRAQSVVTAEYVGAATQTELLVQFFGLVPVAYDIEMYKLTYTTPDPFGVPDTASGLLIVPQSMNTAEYPVAIFHRGTVDNPQDVPSNLAGGHQLGQAMGGLGYVTIMPDYLGAGEARGFHPYVHAATEASASLDMLRALHDYAPTADIMLNDQLFITGYSQGGHASMALHRSIELDHSDEFTVTAASHMSGPYSISGEMTELILSMEPYGTPAYLPNTFLSYNYVYDLYDDLEAVFLPAYVPMIESYFNNEIGLFDLNQFLVDTLTVDFGASVTRFMLQDSIIDILENEPDHPINIALRQNDVYEWAPQAPTRLMYCTADDQVVYTNALVADSVMQLLGAADVAAIDVDPTADHGGCVFPASLATVDFFADYQTITVDTDEPSAIMDATYVYPNPTSDALYLRHFTGMADISITDLQGRTVWQGRRQADESIDLYQLDTGVYLTRITVEGKTFVTRVILK